MDCLFCKIVAGEIGAEKLYEDDHVLVFLDINQYHKGHSLVIPKKHFEDIFDIEEEILGKIMSVGKAIAAKLKTALKADGMNVMSNSGKVAGQKVFHFHTHILPRFENDGFDADELWHPQQKIADGAELKSIAEEINK